MPDLPNQPVSDDDTPPAPPHPPADTPDGPHVARKNRFGLSLVWLVPIVALLAAASLLVRYTLQRGPHITIEFRTAEGLEAGKTEIRYKEVVVGRVDSVTLSDDRQHVLVSAQLDRSVDQLAVDDSRFWVVRPRIGTGGISGLGTLLSGAYIGVDAGISTDSRENFVGLESPPYVLRGEPGRGFVLRADDLGSLDVGSPIFYRRTRVGRVVGYTLDAKLDQLLVQVFIESPYEGLVTSQSRFWNASGIDLRLNASGLTLNTQTVASVLAGGIAFEGFGGEQIGRAPAAAGTRFTLFGDRRAALAPPDGSPVHLRMVFDGSVRGLAVDAPIDFLGVDIGVVRSITLEHDAQRERFPVVVTADVFPLRLGAAARDSIEKNLTGDDQADGDRADHRHQAAIRRLVDNGMRAQLRTGNLLTGQLYVAFDFTPSAPKDHIAVEGNVYTVPTVPGTLSELQPQIAEIVGKVSKIPFDSIGRNLNDTLAQVTQAIRSLTPEAQKALGGVQQTLLSVQETLAALQSTVGHVDHALLDDNAPLQRNLDATMTQLQRAAESLRTLTDYLQRHPESLLRGNPADAPLQPVSPARRSSPAPSPAAATPVTP